MSDRRQPRMIAGPMILIGLRVMTTATLAGSPERGPTVSVGFTRGGAWTDASVKLLGEATSSLLVQAYSCTTAPIATALVDAHQRGVRVDVLLDQDTRPEQYSAADVLANQGVPTKIDAEHAIAHHQIIIIDGETVITGSFHLTKAAQEKNAENLLVIRDKALAAQDTVNWQAPAQHSQPYVGRGVRE